MDLIITYLSIVTLALLLQGCIMISEMPFIWAVVSPWETTPASISNEALSNNSSGLDNGSITQKLVVRTVSSSMIVAPHTGFLLKWRWACQGIGDVAFWPPTIRVVREVFIQSGNVAHSGKKTQLNGILRCWRLPWFKQQIVKDRSWYSYNNRLVQAVLYLQGRNQGIF